MDSLVSKYQKTNSDRSSLVSREDQALAHRTALAKKKGFLHQDQPNVILLPLRLNRHNVLIALSILPFRLPAFPASVLFGLTIERVHACCDDSSWKKTWREKVGVVLEECYPQVTIHASQLILDPDRLDLASGLRCEPTTR